MIDKKSLRKIMHDYQQKRKIDIYKYLDDEKRDILKRLEIDIEDRLYTEYEYDILDEKVLEYYTDPNDEELKPIKLLSKKGVSREEYNKILEIFEKISDSLWK